MADKIIKSVKQLPEWFQLDNYTEAKNFQAAEWFDELMARLFVRQNFKNNDETIKDQQYLWESIKRSGLLYHEFKKQELKLRLTRLSPFLHHLISYKEKSPRCNQSQSVNSITKFSMYGSFLFRDKKDQIEINNKMIALVNKDFGPLEDKPGENIVDWLMQPYDNCENDLRLGLENKFSYAKVNLDASDEQIKHDFDTWLAIERERRHYVVAKKNFNLIDFKSWHESSILPYLDLMFWSQIETVKINQYAVAQAIYPDAYALDSEVDPLGKLKTTKKKSAYLMNHETLKLLEMQVDEHVVGDNKFMITTETET